MTDTQNKIVEEGKTAFRLGTKFNRNPYRYSGLAEGNEMFHLWRRGWNIARKEADE